MGQPGNHGCMGQTWTNDRCSEFDTSQGLPSGYVKIAIENGQFIVDLPIENGDFPVRYVNVYQAG